MAIPDTVFIRDERPDYVFSKESVVVLFLRETSLVFVKELPQTVFLEAIPDG